MQCLLCHEPITNPDQSRKKYHDECREPAKEANRPIRCTKCKQVKPPSKFSNDSTRVNGKFPYCVDCQARTTTRFQDSALELNGHTCPVDDTLIRGHANRRFCSMRCKEKARNLKLKYGLTVEQFRALVAATGGRCPICTKRPTEWHIDHNHQTGKVTGVVCGPCNIGPLASSLHRIDLAQRVVDYLTLNPAAQLGIDVVVPDNKARTSSQLHKRWGYRR